MYFIFAALLLLFAFVVFRLVVRRDYAARGRLSPLPSSLQLLVMLGFFSFPYLYNPPQWARFWRLSSSTHPALFWAGFIMICLGMVLAFGTMAWFGIGRAFGIKTDGLARAGPYRFSRNPQILGGYLLVIGSALQWLSLYALGWVTMYALISHWMVITEEEHLLWTYGGEFETYCAQVPRYLFAGRN